MEAALHQVVEDTQHKPDLMDSIHKPADHPESHGWLSNLYPSFENFANYMHAGNFVTVRGECKNVNRLTMHDVMLQEVDRNNGKA